MHSKAANSADINSLSPGRSECDPKNVNFNLVLLIGIFRSFHYNALWWMEQDLTDDKSTLVQVMAWCRQATSHYLNQCWLSSLSPYGVTRPQWVNLMKTEAVNVIKVTERKFLKLVVENRKTLTLWKKKSPKTYHYIEDGIYILTYSNNIDLIRSLKRKLHQSKLLLSSTTCMLRAYYENYLCG